MKLYTFPPAPNPARVNFFINEKRLAGADLDLEIVITNLLTGEQQKPEFLKLNPVGTLPVLELDDGTVIRESLPIMEFLEEIYPAPPLIGDSPRERARIRSIERSIEMNVLARVARAVHATRSPLGLPANPALAENELKRLPAALQRVDELLSDRDFAAGAQPSIADCTLLAAMNFARFGELQIDGDYPHLTRWQELYALRHL